MKGKSSPSTPIPLQILRPGGGGGGEEESRNSERELQIVDTTSPISSRFKLPDDWVVEERTRRRSTTRPGQVDRYYHEPGTGRMFRSLIAVQKYLTEETKDALTPETVKPGNENNMQIVAHIVSSTSRFELPDGWVIEQKPRSNINYAGIVDKCYIEPVTGRRFRSLRAVERYLTEEKEITTKPEALKSCHQSTKENISDENCSLEIIVKRLANAKKNKITPKVLKPGNHSTPSKNSGSRRENISCEEGKTSMLNFTSPPAKVKWVLSGPGGNIWSPFMGESVVPGSERQKWSERFIFSVQDKF